VVNVARINFARHIFAGFKFAHPARINIEADHGAPAPPNVTATWRPTRPSPTTAIFRNCMPLQVTGSLGIFNHGWVVCHNGYCMQNLSLLEIGPVVWGRGTCRGSASERRRGQMFQSPPSEGRIRRCATGLSGAHRSNRLRSSRVRGLVQSN
jgi:hypothetical protein